MLNLQQMDEEQKFPDITYSEYSQNKQEKSRWIYLIFIITISYFIKSHEHFMFVSYILNLCSIDQATIYI